MLNLEVRMGDILCTNSDVIAHQTNCLGVMGSGVALCIKQEYPEVYTEYRSLCGRIPVEQLLGRVQIVPTHDGKYIANCFGQASYGWGKLQTDYNALENSLNDLANWMIANNKSSIAIPYKIGCVRGGGDWSLIENIITRVFYNKPIHVELWKLR